MIRIKSRKNVPELTLVGDVDQWEEDVVKALAELPERGEIVLYIDSSGGSVYGALAIVTMLRLKRLRATVVVLGECSSAALLIFGAARRRLVTPFSTLLFHRMRWQSEKHIDVGDARQWAQHFEQLESDLQRLQRALFGKAEPLVQEWTAAGRYLTGVEIAAAGLAELIHLD
ncbi:MAG TPA: ATP-dependent Clp protease proteolytic subunit [Gemmatales bacterium]|nr:ATP-dependent Clp protease proteolytic subunit [Gemmatales bacterium]HMP58631.1 ATP-dependent Clp protease proteolytic subunit [Gemmatales bacterium]